MNSAKPNPMAVPASAPLERAYLLAIPLVLAALLTYLGSVASATPAAQTPHPTESAMLPISPLSLAYAGFVWLVIPGFLIFCLWRKNPRRPKFMVSGLDQIPIVQAKPTQAKVVTAKQAQAYSPQD